MAKRVKEDYQALFSSPLEHPRLADIGERGRGYVASVTTILGIEQIRSLMLAVLRTFPPDDATKAFRQMLSWSVRFLVVGSGGGGYLDRNYGDVASEITGGRIKTAHDLKSRMATVVPSDSQFTASFRTHNISKAVIARYILRSLEAALREEDEPQVMYYEMTETNNLEHILPRNPSADWSVPTDVAIAYFKRIGNMTLFRSRDNVIAGNATFKEKKQLYASSDWQMTKNLRSFKNWGPNQIERRQNGLSDLAVRVWPL